MRAADGTKDLLWLTRFERGIWTAKSCDLTLHTHMLTNAKSVLTFEIGFKPW